MIDLICQTAPPHAVPVAALFRRAGLPAPLAALAEASVLRDPVPDPGLDAIAEGTLEAATLVPIATNAVPARHAEAATLVHLLAAHVPAATLFGLDFVEALAQRGAGQLGTLFERSSSDRWTLDAANESEHRRTIVEELLLQAIGDAPAGVDAPAVALLRRMSANRAGERAAAGAALATDSALVGCHGADLEFTLGASPRLALGRQLSRLRALGVCGAGRVILFAPCDPHRPECVAVARESLSRGFVGLALHAAPPFPAGPIGPASGEPLRVVKARLLEVLRAAADAGAPVVVHLDAWIRHARLDRSADAGASADAVRAPVRAAVAAWDDLLGHRRLRGLQVAFGIGSQAGTAPEFPIVRDAVMDLAANRPNTTVVVPRDLPRPLATAVPPRREQHAAALELLDIPAFLGRCGDVLANGEREGLQRVARGEGVEDAARAAPRRRSGRRHGSAARARSVVLGRDGAGTSPWDVDCLVIGAGIAGLAAARDLVRPQARWAQSRTVTVLEASPRIGGRIHTARDLAHGPIELGAELIHRPAHDQLMGGFSLWDDVNRYGLSTRAIGKLQGSHVYFPTWKSGGAELRAGCAVCGDPDVSKALDVLSRVASWKKRDDALAGDLVAELLRSHAAPIANAEAMADLLLTGTVPGRLGELSVAGLAADKVKDQELSTEEYHVDAGYDQLPRALAQGIDVRTGVRVVRIAYGNQGVTVEADDGTVLRARCAICTVSVGVLKSGAIAFDPPLPASKVAALDRVENGPISKVVLRFDRRFWPDDMSLLGNPGRQRRAGRSYFVPLYGAAPAANGSSSAILTALFNGNEARELDRRMGGHAEGDSSAGLPAAVRARVDDYVRRNILADLDEIFPGAAAALAGWRVRSWANDPFTLGGTSFIRFEDGARSRDAASVRQALADHLPTLPLYWAGEACALGTNPWSVHGAHQSGRAAARNAHAYLELPTG